MARAQAVDTASGKGLVRFRMDEVLKNQADAALEQMGLSMANVVTMLSRRIVAEGKLPFEIYAVSTPVELTRAAMLAGRAIIHNNRARFGDAQELINAIEAETGGANSQ